MKRLTWICATIGFLTLGQLALAGTLSDSLLYERPASAPQTADDDEVITLAQKGRPKPQFNRAAGRRGTVKPQGKVRLNTGRARPRVSAAQVSGVRFPDRISVSGSPTSRKLSNSVKATAKALARRPLTTNASTTAKKKLRSNKPTTVKNGQSAKPRTLNEKLLFIHLSNNPSKGKPLNLNDDPRFLQKDGWQKMQMTFKTIKKKYIRDSGPVIMRGSSVVARYQYNKYTGEVADIKFTSKLE